MKIHAIMNIVKSEHRKLIYEYYEKHKHILLFRTFIDLNYTFDSHLIYNVMYIIVVINSKYLKFWNLKVTMNMLSQIVDTHMIIVIYRFVPKYITTI